MAPPRRTLDTIKPFMGRDLELQYALRQGYFEDADLVSARAAAQGVQRDLTLTDGVDNFTQAIANRLKTRQGELAALGHPDYGSRHHELMGEPNVDRTRNLIKLYVLQALRDEPRIEKVLDVTVSAEHDPPRDSVRIAMTVRVLGSPTPLNLVLPFSLEVAI
jgi:phage baseplate assembly protein W